MKIPMLEILSIGLLAKFANVIVQMNFEYDTRPNIGVKKGSYAQICGVHVAANVVAEHESCMTLVIVPFVPSSNLLQ